MSKNSILALGLILLTMLLFSSEQYQNFYHNKILGKPSPVQIARQKKAEADSLARVKGTTGVTSKVADSVAPAPAILSSMPAATPQAAQSLQQSTTSLDTTTAVVGPETLWVETPTLRCGISTMGARIVSLRTRDYRYHYGSGVVVPEDRPVGEMIELIPHNGLGGANLRIDNQSYDSLVFSSKDTATQPVVVTAGSERKLLLTTRGRDGREVSKEFTFHDKGYRIDCTIHSIGLTGRNISFGWQSGINESEVANPRASAQERRRMHFSDGKTVEHIQQKKPQREEPQAYLKWAGISTTYFLIATGFPKPTDGEVDVDGFSVSILGGSGGKNATDVDYRYLVRRIAESDQEKMWIYAGPAQLDQLKSYGIRLEGVLYTGYKWFLRGDLWFPPLCEFVLWLLIQLQKFFKDYGLVIILLTVISRLVTFPLTQSSAKSMNRMKDIQPKVNAIRQRHKANPRRMNEEIMALYKTEGINPLNPGCLPIFLQMPVFIALFVVLRKAIELRGATTVLVPWIKDLSQPEALPWITPLFQQMFPTGLPMYGCTIGLLPIIMAALTFVQNKMTIKDPNQKMMIYFMPPFMLIIFNNFSSGLVLYWTFSSLLGIIQQYYVGKSGEKRAALRLAAEAEVQVQTTPWQQKQAKKKKSS